MGKKIIFSLVGILILLTIAGGFFFWQDQKNLSVATDIWNIIKSTISKIGSFGPATIVQLLSSFGPPPPPPPPPQAAGEVAGEVGQAAEQSQEKPATEGQAFEVRPLQSLTATSELLLPLTLADFQKMLNDTAERIDILSAEMSKLTKEEIAIKKEEIKEKKETKIEICQPSSININTASASELEKITEIGPIIAQRTIASRPFYSLNDLLKVKGIGEKTLQKIISQGCAYVDEFYSRLASGSGVSAGLPEKPIINLFYPSENPVNKEIEVNFYTSNLKNSTYDVKISILKISDESEQKRTLSEIYNPNENKWQSSYNYFTNFFSGTSFSRNFKLRIKDQNFRGQVEIIAKIREKEKSNVLLEFNGKISITGPELTQNQLPIASFIFFPQIPFVGDKIIFDASSSTDNGTITNYIWNFGDGNSTTTNLSIATHKYESASSFTVTLLVTDNQDVISSPASTTIRVNPSPSFSVVINEIAWMGTTSSSWDEWIELYNNTSSSIDLLGWKIKKNEEDFIEISTSTMATTIISANSFYLLERAEKATDLPGDFVYKGNKLMTNDSCEILSLYDQFDNLIDQTVCFSKNWPGGKASFNYISMERISTNLPGTFLTNWTSNNTITKNGKDVGGNSINATLKAENSVSKIQSIYLCPQAKSIAEIYPNCPGRANLQLGENENGIFVSIVEQEEKEYYAISGIENGGGGVNLKLKASLPDFYLGKVNKPLTLSASSSDPNDDSLEYRWDFDFDGKWDLTTITQTIEHSWNKEHSGFILLEVSDGEFVTRAITFIKIKK